MQHGPVWWPRLRQSLWKASCGVIVSVSGVYPHHFHAYPNPAFRAYPDSGSCLKFLPYSNVVRIRIGLNADPDLDPCVFSLKISLVSLESSMFPLELGRPQWRLRRNIYNFRYKKYKIFSVAKFYNFLSQ